MPPSIPRHQLISGSRATALGTLASRVLGMLRDMATAAILGLSGGGVMDAFVLAFRIPNTFRRLFGEGALAASYLPVISAELERQPHRAWKLASVLFAHLAGLLLFLVLAGEAALGVLALAFDSPEIRLFASLAAVMLPYMLLICLAAQASATLHALGHFALPALVPTILNVVWLVAAVAVAPWISPDKAVQAHVLAVAILVAGVLQLAVQIPLLRARGFRFDYDPRSAREKFTLILKAMGPMTVGLMITQINSLIDSLVAWLLSSPSPDGGPISWLGGCLDYPMAQGAVGALYYAERLYQFPLGILGLAVATAIFPLLSRHAARNDQPRFSQDLTLGLRLVLFLGVPASAGLVLLAEPLARLLFQHREFTSQDALRTARVIAGYSWGVWAYGSAADAGVLCPGRADHAHPHRDGDRRAGLHAQPGPHLVHGRNGPCHLDVDRLQSTGRRAGGLILSPQGSARLAIAGGHQFKDDHRNRAHVQRRGRRNPVFPTPPGWPEDSWTSSSRWPSQWRSTWPPLGSLKSGNWGSYSPGGAKAE